MARVPFWADPALETELVWNQCSLDDIVLPGLARVRGTLKADIEAKKAKGNDGADYSDNGLTPCGFTIELQMWEELQWEAYQGLLPQLLPRKRGAARKLWTVQHPACQLMGVAKVYIHEFPFPEPDDDGMVRVALKVLEYIPAPKPVKPRVETVKDDGYQVSEALVAYPDTGAGLAYGKGGDGGDGTPTAGTPIGNFAAEQADKDTRG